MSDGRATATHNAGLDVKNQRLLNTQFSDWSAIRVQEHLKTIHQLLVPLDDRVSTIPPMNQLLPQLLHKRVLEHRKTEVRIHVAAVLVEVLRLTVERERLEADKTILIFSSLERVLREVADPKSKMFDMSCDIIDTVNTTQAYALLIDACGGGVTQDSDEALEPMVSFMTAAMHALDGQSVKKSR